MKGEAAVLEHLRHVAPTEVCMPQPVVAEITFGIERLPGSKRKEALSARWELIKREIRRGLWTDEVSHTFGELKATLERRGQRIEDFDVAVAAHALTEGAVLVTANLKHLARVLGLAVEDWSRSVEG